MSKCEQWKLDNRMGGGSLSLLAAYITDIISHILSEQATRVHSYSVRSPSHAACDSFTTFHLSFPSGVTCAASVAFTNYFEFELIFTCTNGTIRLDSNLNVTTQPPDMMRHFDLNGRRTESVIESDTEPETGNEETANETEVETEPQQKSETAGDEEEDSEVIETIDQTTQTIIEKRNAKTETDCNFVCSSPIPFMIRGIPRFIECIKNAFIEGGYDPRAWDHPTLTATPVANFGDVLYIQGVLDGARRSDRSGEWESVETNEEHESTLKFQQ